VNGDAVAGPDTMSLSVILCVHNGAASMRGQLDALVHQQWDQPWEILVVDNASTDSTVQVAEEYLDAPVPLRIVRAPERLGLSYARNVGVAQARGRSVAFCDDDDRVGDGWVAAMGRALDEHRVVASRMEYEQLSDPAARLGRADFQSDGIEHLFGYPIVNGASGWRRDLWQALGGNDESLDFSGEDHDMALRAVLHEGVVPHFAADAVYHCGRRQGLPSTFRQARRYGRAQALLYRRYGRGRPGARPPVVLALKQWAWLLKHAGDSRDPDRETLWAWRAGLRVGRLEGSVHERTLFL
jgi:glycosyltransferase involved in cell wall biosynthesis